MEEYLGLTDAALLDRFRRLNDRDALATLVLRYHRIVRVVCRQVLGPSPEEEDAYQMTYLLLLRRADRIRRAQSVGSWLYGVAYRVAWRLRQQRARRLPKATMSTLAGHEAEPFAILSAEDQRLAAHAAIAALPNSLRMPLVLRYLEGRTNREVAELLSLTEAAVEGRLKRAKARLRGQLARRGLLLTTLLAAVEQVASNTALATGAIDPSLEATIAAIHGGHALRNKDAEQTFHQILREEVKQMLQKQLMNWSVAAGVCAITTVAVLGSPGTRSGIAEQRGASTTGGAARVVTPEPASDVAPFGSADVRIASPDGAMEDPFAQANAAVDPLREGNADGTQAAPLATLSGAAGEGSAAASAPIAGWASQTSQGGFGDSTTPTGRDAQSKFRTNAQDPATQAILAALDQPTKVEFFDEPLRDAMNTLSEAHGIPIRFSQTELDAIGLTPDTPITMNVADISLASALNLILKDLGLAYTISNEVLLVTSEEGAMENTSIQVYTMVEDWPLTADATIDLIRTQVAPDTWDEVGGNGSIDGFGLTLVVNQAMSVHQQIEKLLTQLDDSFRANPAAAAAAQAAMKSRPTRKERASRPRADGRVDGVDGPPTGLGPSETGMGGFH